MTSRCEMKVVTDFCCSLSTFLCPIHCCFLDFLQPLWTPSSNFYLPSCFHHLDLPFIRSTEDGILQRVNLECYALGASFTSQMWSWSLVLFIHIPSLRGLTALCDSVTIVKSNH